MGLWGVVKLGTQVDDFCQRFGEGCFIVLFKLYQGGLRVLEGGGWSAVPGRAETLQSGAGSRTGRSFAFPRRLI